jgi:hypothetical protein
VSTNSFYDVSFFHWQKTSFMLFLNKFDIFEKKILNVRAVQTFTLRHWWENLLSFFSVYYLCVGPTQRMWMVQRLSASFNRETRDRACIWVSKVVDFWLIKHSWWSLSKSTTMVKISLPKQLTCFGKLCVQVCEEKVWGIVLPELCSWPCRSCL